MQQQQYIAIAIATVFALVGVVPLAGRNVRRPLLWVLLLAGAGVGYLAREGTRVALDLISPYIDLATNPAGVAVTGLIGAAVGELLKATPTLAAVSVGSTDEGAGLAYGAAAGAGFGAFVTWPILTLMLGLIGSPVTSAFSAGVAILGWFFRILANTVTTAYVGRAGVVGGLGGALFLAWMIQFIIGLAERMPVVAAIPTSILVTAAIALAMFFYLRGVKSKAASARART